MSPRDGIAASVLAPPDNETGSMSVTLPLSSQQARLWELHHVEPNARPNITAGVHLRGPLDLPCLLRSVDALAERHDVLRTAFPLDGRPRQWIRPTAPQELLMLDLRGSDSRAAAAAARSFDLANGPAWRTILVRLGEHDHQLVISAHALVADARSLRLLVRELLATYDRLLGGRAYPDVPVQFAASATFARAMRDEDTRVRALSYWHERLDGVSALDLPRSPTSRRGARHALTFPEPLCDQVAQLGQRQGVTLDVTLLALFEVLLHRYTGQTDLAVGTRCVRTEPAESQLVGPLSSIVMARADLSGMPSGLDCLRRVHEVVRAARHHHLPYEDLVEALGLPAVPQTLFACESRPALAAPHGLTADWIELDLGTATAHLALELFHDAPRLSGHIEYDCDLFDAVTIARMADHLLRLAHGLVDNPGGPVALLAMVSAAEQHELLRRARGPVDLPVPDVAVHALFEAQVDRTPAATALVWHDGSWTYQELDRRANQLARRLAKLGVTRDTPVCVYVDRSPEMIAALLGILKAGGAYVPLDAGYPRERLAYVLEGTKTPLLLTQSALAPSLPDHDVHTLCLDTEWPDESPERLGAEVSPSQLAYVIYTSGSTGKPKGVMIEHRALVHYTTAAAHVYEVSPSDRVAQFSSISFDASVEEIFPTLTRGATLSLRRSSTLEAPDHFLAHCAERELTVLSLPTAYWHELVAALARGEATIPASLRLMIIGGERATTTAWAAWQQHAPRHVRLLNTYGPSEATVVTTTWDAASGGAELPTVPIGRPLPHTSAYVLDAHRQLVPLGVPGELYIGGAAVGRGYLGAPALTTERFGDDPFSPGRMFRTGDRCRLLPGGDLEFLGRDDDQLKLAGHRIELGEIEARLRDHPDVEEAVVVARDRSGQIRLDGFVVARVGATPNEHQLRSHLQRWFVPHLIPSLSLVDELPLTVNGKIDRAALVERSPAASAASTADGPRDPIEELVHQLFCELLPGKPVGIRDDFFTLGGDSLSTVELVSLLGARLDVDVPAQIVFENPTVEALAQAVVTHIHGESAHAAIAPEALAAEARLDATIRPAPRHAPAPPQTLLVTGATGFFGAFLLADLVAATSARVHCLVRAASNAEAQARLLAAFRKYLPTRALPIERVTAVAGDLAQSGFGLSDDAFHELAGGVDAVFHAGATVHYLRPYRALRASNVLGTEEVLRFAATERTKPVHHVSSLSVFGSTEQAVGEDTPLDGRDLSDGYSQSKWVAEQLVAQARQRGIPVAIYRPGRLTGHSQTGASNASDLLDIVIQACVRLGAAPDLDLLVDMVPVDFASAALVSLAGRPESLGKTFHLGHPRPITWRRLVAALASFGYPLRVLPYESWTAALRQYATHRQAGRALLSAAGLSLPELREALGAHYDCGATLDALAMEPPAIDDALLRAGFAHLVRTGLVDAPEDR
jgi:amino acid adenylation domain-containing protein/thioester reductase-like protein